MWRKMERHLDVEDSVVTQFAVDQLLVDVLRKIDLSDHRLLENGVVAVFQTLRDERQFAAFDAQLDLSAVRRRNVVQVCELNCMQY